MTFDILEEMWFGGMDDGAARSAAAASLAAKAAKLHGLKPFPVAAQRLLQMIDTRDYKVPAVADIIESDPALATKVLRVVNSAGTGLRTPCRSVQGAVALLGQHNLRKTILSAAVFMTFSSEDDHSVQLMDHSATVAAFCRELSRPLELPGEEMYTCGLLHDIGKLMLLQTGDAAYPGLLDEFGNQNAAMHVRETELYGFDHGVLGGQILSDWRIPEPIPKIVGWHHNVTRAAEPKLAAMVMLIHLSDRLARSLRTNPDEGFFEREAQSEDASMLGLSAAMLQGMWPRMCESAEAAVAALFGREEVKPQPELRRSLVPNAIPKPKDPPCTVCGEPSLGATCPRCKQHVCTAHEPRRTSWCMRCESEFQAQQTTTSRMGAIAGGILALVTATAGVALIQPFGPAIAGIAAVALLLELVGSAGFLAWQHWDRRARFLRSGKSK